MHDLKSDTLTKPSESMLKAMLSASVGDDVFDEDPTALALQDHCAALFNKEAALFVASGTQSNLIATILQTPPGCEMIVDNNCHINCYEASGSTRFGGLSLATIDNPKGNITAQDIENTLKPDNIHFPRTTAVAIENTHNRKGGTVYPAHEVAELYQYTQAHHLKLHIDGARIWNATIASGAKITDYSSHCDSITFCLSKGLGCPVGSILLGTKEFIYKTKRLRKALGGGMRQIGYLAAAGIYALKNNIERLQEDHDNAQAIAASLKEIGLKVNEPETNIIVFEPAKLNVPDTLELLKKKNILGVAFGKDTIRLVTHLNISSQDTTQVCETIKETL